MKTLNTLNKSETRIMNGGEKLWRCKHCGFTSSSYAKAYANALACVTRKYGRPVYRFVSFFLG